MKILVLILSLSFSASVSAITMVDDKKLPQVKITEKMRFHSLVNRLRDGKSTRDQKENKVERIRYSLDRKKTSGKCTFTLKKVEYKGVYKCENFRETKRRVKGEEKVFKIPQCPRENKESSVDNLSIKAIASLTPQKEDKKFFLSYQNEKFYFRNEKAVNKFLEQAKEYSKKNCQ